MNAVKPHVSKSEAARRIGVSRRTIYTMIEEDRLPSDELGRIPRAAFNEFIAMLRGAGAP